MSIYKAAIPVVLGVSLCGVTATVLYLLFKNNDDDDDNIGAKDSLNIRKQNTVEAQIMIPNNLIPAFVGRGGANIKKIQENSGASLNLTSAEIGDTTKKRFCVIRGNLEAVNLAKIIVEDFLSNQPIIDEKIIFVPQWSCGRIIGQSGKNIRNICHTSGAKVTIDSKNQDQSKSTEQSVVIKGTKEQIAIAVEMLEHCVDLEKCSREVTKTPRAPRGPSALSDSPAPSDSSSTGQSAADHSPLTESGTPRVDATHAPSRSGACLEVVVSAVSSPSKFWLQLCGPQTENLDALVDQMTSYYSNKDNQELHELRDVQVGQIVAAVFRHDGRWYRAQVIEIKPNEYDSSQMVADLLFVDYGDCEYVAIKELKELRTDMLRLKFQAIECFLAGIAPVGSEDPKNLSVHHCSKWHPKAIEYFFEVTQAARWKKLLSRTCSFRNRSIVGSAVVCGGIASVGRTTKGPREESLIPGVKLYDTLEDGTEVDIGALLLKEGWAVEADEQSKPSTPPTTPLSPHAPNTPFGDLEISRVLGMVEDREEMAGSLPKQTSGDDSHSGDHEATSPSMTTSLQDDSTPGQAKFSSHADLSYPGQEGSHANGSAHNGHDSFMEAERSQAMEQPQHMHRMDSKDDLKAKMTRIHSNHGLETMDRIG